jgi:hypothetical protein
VPTYRPFEAQFAAARHACRVGGELVGVGALTVREMNFGQHFRTPDLPTSLYEIRVERAFVASFLVAEIRELRECLEQDGEDDLDDLERELVERAWPEPRRLLEDPVLGAAVVRHFSVEFLLSCLSATKDAIPRWVVNSVDEVKLDGDDVILRGVVGRADLRRAYQDF